MLRPSDDGPSSSTLRLKWIPLMVEKVTRRDSRYPPHATHHPPASTCRTGRRNFQAEAHRQRCREKKRVRPVHTGREIVESGLALAARRAQAAAGQPPAARRCTAALPPQVSAAAITPLGRLSLRRGALRRRRLPHRRRLRRHPRLRRARLRRQPPPLPAPPPPAPPDHLSGRSGERRKDNKDEMRQNIANEEERILESEGVRLA